MTSSYRPFAIVMRTMAERGAALSPPNARESASAVAREARAVRAHPDRAILRGRERANLRVRHIGRRPQRRQGVAVKPKDTTRRAHPEDAARVRVEREHASRS